MHQGRPGLPGPGPPPPGRPHGAPDNVVRGNLVRGGDIRFPTTNPLLRNTVAMNRVEGGNILLSLGGSSFIGRNTSVENAGCDINDTAASGSPQNTWTENRFVKGCDAATK